MASVVQLCNMALSHIGADARVASISPPDGSVEAGHCATFYDPARTETLELGNWNFSLARVELAEVPNLSTRWGFAYQLPSDCLRAVRVLALLSPQPFARFYPDFGDVVGIAAKDNASAEYEIEGEVIYTNEPQAVLLYVRDVIDSDKFTPSFTTALSYLLASYIAGPVIKGADGMRIGDAMRERAKAMAAASATAAANASYTEHNFTPSSVRAR